MSNGLGTGFAALSLIAVLAGLALLVVLSTIVSCAFYRRTGHTPPPLRYLFVVIGIGVLGVTGFGILALADEAPVLAWLFACVALVPLVVVRLYLSRTTGLTRVEAITTTVMAWGLPFLLGVVVAFGVTNGLNAAFGLAPAESRRLGIAWIASAVGGLTVVLGMLPIGARLGGMVRAETGIQESV